MTEPETRESPDALEPATETELEAIGREIEDLLERAERLDARLRSLEKAAAALIPNS